MIPNTTQTMIERLKALHGFSSDYAVAKHLGITPQAIYRWNKGEGQMDDTTAVQIADELGEAVMPLLAQLKLERRHTARDARIWSRYAARILPTAVAALVVGFSQVAAPLKAEAAAIASDPIYIMRTIWRWLRDQLRANTKGSAERGPVAGFAPFAALPMLTLRVHA